MRRTSSNDFASASAFQVLRGIMPVSSVSRGLHRVAGKQIPAGAVELCQRADRAWRVSRQMDQHHAAIAEHIALSHRARRATSAGPIRRRDSRWPRCSGARAAANSSAWQMKVALRKNALQPQ